jgi:chromosome segregation ATPase
MDDQDIVKMIKEEEQRLDERKKQVEEKVKENNDKFDELTKKKTMVMGMANEIVQEEQWIQESGAQVKILAG